MTPNLFMVQAQKLEQKILVQKLLGETLVSLHGSAATLCDGLAEYAYRIKLHTLLDETLDTSNELIKLKEAFVKSNR